MVKLTKSYKEYLFERLQNPAQAAGYLNAALEEDDVDGFFLALRDVVEAQGLANVATAASLNRENLYRIISDGGNPTLANTINLLGAMGIGFQVAPTGAEIGKSRRANRTSKAVGKARSMVHSKESIEVKVSSKKMARKLSVKLT